jgi:hypothetical protein
MLCENSVLLIFPVLRSMLHPAFFSCIGCQIGKELETESDMVSKVSNKVYVQSGFFAH